MAKKKNNNVGTGKVLEKSIAKTSADEEVAVGDEAVIDPAIIEDTFTEEFSEYNDVDNL